MSVFLADGSGEATRSNPERAILVVCRRRGATPGTETAPLEVYASDHMADRSDVVYVDDPRNDSVTKFIVD